MLLPHIPFVVTTNVPDGIGDDTVLDVLVETEVDEVEVEDDDDDIEVLEVTEVEVTEVEISELDVEVGRSVDELEDDVVTGGASPHLPYCG